MKNLIILLSLLLCWSQSIAQDQESEIRELEQMEVRAVLAKDSIMLLKLWDENFIVNAPNNRVVPGGTTALDRPVLKMPRSNFEREVEQVTFLGDVALSMGNETVWDSTDRPPYKRRYTNIWMKKNGTWKLMARHANLICEKK